MFSVNDSVAFTAAFLKSVGWVVDVPKSGTVVAVSSTHHVKVDWHDGHGPSGVHVKNLRLVSKPDYSAL